MGTNREASISDPWQCVSGDLSHAGYLFCFFLSGTFIFFDHFPLVPKVFPFCSVSWLLQKHASWTVRILLIYFLYKVKEASELHSQHSFASLFVERRSDLSQVSQRSYQ